MAASKITNNVTTANNHPASAPPPPPPQQPSVNYPQPVAATTQAPYHQPQQQPQYQPQINSPVLSIASSLVSSDSSATNHQSSPDISTDTTTATPQINSPTTNHSADTTLPNTPSCGAMKMVGATGGGGGGSVSETVAMTSGGSASTTNPPSPENDFKSIGSVLEKLSMFEKIQNNNAATAAAIAATGTPPSTPPISAANCGLSAATVSKVESILNRKNEEIYRAIGSAEKDPGMFFLSFFSIVSKSSIMQLYQKENA